MTTPSQRQELVERLLDLYQTVLNKAHTQGQDDYREGASDSSVRRHYDEFELANSNFRSAIADAAAAIERLGRELAAAKREAGQWAEKYADCDKLRQANLDELCSIQHILNEHEITKGGFCDGVEQLAIWLADLARQREALRDALEPFAKAAPHVERLADEVGIWATHGTRPEWNYCITVSHVRAAKQALAAAQGAQKP